MNEIVVAVIGMASALIVAMIETTRRQNNRDHAINAGKLDQVIDKIDNVDSRLGSHIEWHAHKDS
jgi:cellobiose-specific phosphotransferase system component IIB